MVVLTTIQLIQVEEIVVGSVVPIACSTNSTLFNSNSLLLLNVSSCTLKKYPKKIFDI